MQISSTRFGEVEVRDDAVLEFPDGLIGLPGTRYALLGDAPDSPFFWLHSVDHDDVAVPVTNPWLFFDDYGVELSDADTARVGSETPDVWVTVRTGAAPQDFSANLRAPILVADGRGHQVINEASDAPVRAPLFTDAAVGQAA